MTPRANAFAIISNQGFTTVAARLDARIRKGSGCWEYSGYTVNGYGRIKVGNVAVLAHRAAWIVANRADPADKLVCHTCDNRLCCNPAHLFLGTALDNARDMAAKGRRASQTGPRRRVRGPKLTAFQAADIRRDTRPLAEIAAAYGISRNYAGHVRRGARWPFVPTDDFKTVFHDNGGK